MPREELHLDLAPKKKVVIAEAQYDSDEEAKLLSSLQVHPHDSENSDESSDLR
jgi:hypothetical protein